MSTMFSGGGSSSAASVGADAAAAAPSTANPAAKSAPVTPAPGAQGAAPAQGGDPFFKETVTIDGKPVEVSYATREEMVADIRKARAADRRFQTAAQEKKEAADLRAQAIKAQQEADAIRAKYGDDALSASLDAAIESGDPERIKKARATMEQRLASLIRQDMMDPTERELANERRLRQQAEGKLQTQAQKEAQAAQEAETSQWREQFSTTIIGALETGQVPNTDWTASIMAKLMSINMKKGYKLNPEQLAGKTKAVIMNQVTGLLSTANGDQIIEMFPDLVKKVRAADLKRLRSKQPNLPGKKILETKAPTPPAPDGDTQNGYMTTDQWRDWTKRRAAAAQAGLPLPER